MPSTVRGQTDQPLKLALAVALLLHAGLIFGVSFDSHHEDNYRPQIDVTLAQRPSSLAPSDATHFAQANQQGSGDRAEQADVTTATPPAPFTREAKPTPAPTPWREAPEAQRRERALATQAAAERSVAAEQHAQSSTDSTLLGVSPEIDQLSRELASLEANLDEQNRAYSNMPRVRRLTTLSTRASIDAAYLHDWRRRVEAVGNQYYPEASIRYGIYGSLRLLVVIDYSGHLEDIRVLSSSGYALLDEAAIKIVRMAAPYAPFPPELRATADKLEIIRTWQFQENRLSSG